MPARLAALLVLLLLAGCGGAAAGGEGETATLWITRDRGSEVLFEGPVPAGLTVLQALDREADVETRYGGRFVQAVNGLEGSLSSGRDWFYFVNGVAADRGAGEYRLRAGEVAWWDYHEWRGAGEVAAVVGAFPEPLLQGYRGADRPVAVRYRRPAQEPAARSLAAFVGADSVALEGVPVPAGASVLRIADGPAGRFTARAESPGGPYALTLSGAAAARLARDPTLARFRFEGLP